MKGPYELHKSKISLIQNLLKKDKSVSIHQENSQLLAAEMFTITWIMIFLKRKICHTNCGIITYPNVFRFNGTETFFCLGPKIWILLQNEITQLDSN